MQNTDTKYLVLLILTVLVGLVIWGVIGLVAWGLAPEDHRVPNTQDCR
jgi:hypothetical protein